MIEVLPRILMYIIHTAVIIYYTGYYLFKQAIIIYILGYYIRLLFVQTLYNNIFIDEDAYQPPPALPLPPLPAYSCTVPRLPTPPSQPHEMTAATNDDAISSNVVDDIGQPSQLQEQNNETADDDGAADISSPGNCFKIL